MSEPNETQNFDVVVVGGGAAGVAAAIGAAQCGSAVCLIEQYGFLGGAATASSVLTHCGFFDQTKTQVVQGIGQKLLDKLHQRNIYRTETFSGSGNTVVLLDLETTKTAFDELVAEAGVTLFLHSSLVSAATRDGLIDEVEVAHRGGRIRIRGRAFVDGSGDGSLIAAAGADAIISPTDERQASTLVMRVGGVAEDADLSVEGQASAVRSYTEQTGASLTRDNGTAVRMPISGEVMLLLADQHRDVLDVRELTAAEVQARQQCWHYFEAFRNFLPGWGSSFLAATGPQLGIRESRRLRGRDSVSADDVSSGRKRPDDAVARCGWPMEDHIVPGVTV
ncbi:MAG: FAD-dependent oxidoreductase, partial [Acidobacteria bacterium]|nr:FAD-dependent oxidoreductase [Acidobacteriota bacterium]